PAGRRAAETQVIERSVTLGSATAAPGSIVGIPVNVTGADGILSYRVAVDYDPAIAEFIGIETETTLAQEFVHAINDAVPGQVILSAAGVQPIDALSGTIAVLKFQVKSDAEGSAAIALNELTRLNDTSVGVTTAGGNITASTAPSDVEDWMLY